MKIIDISILINDKNKTPTWPGGNDLKIKSILNIKENICNETSIEMSSHIGTHIDAPFHFIAKGQLVDQFNLDIFIGTVFVAYLPKVKNITSFDLEKLKIPVGIKRILFKTENSLLWKKKISKFTKKYVGITSDGAIWLSKHNFKLIGVDYLSVAKFTETAEVHKILLSKKIVLLESIDLSKVKSGIYELVCLPLKISGLEASPTRAVLIKK